MREAGPDHHRYHSPAKLNRLTSQHQQHRLGSKGSMFSVPFWGPDWNSSDGENNTFVRCWNSAFEHESSGLEQDVSPQTSRYPENLFHACAGELTLRRWLESVLVGAMFKGAPVAGIDRSP